MIRNEKNQDSIKNGIFGIYSQAPISENILE